MIRNQSHYHVVTPSVLSVSSSFSSIKWSSAPMIRLHITVFLKIYQLITQYWQHYQWVCLLHKQMVITVIQEISLNNLLDFVMSIHPRKSSFTVRMIVTCSAPSVFWSILKWSTKSSRYHPRLMKWRRWSRKWFMRLISMINLLLSMRNFIISWKWKYGRSLMKKLINLRKASDESWIN